MILGEEVYEVEDDDDEEFETLDSVGGDDDGKWLQDDVRPRGIWGKWRKGCGLGEGGGSQEGLSMLYKNKCLNTWTSEKQHKNKTSSDNLNVLVQAHTFSWFGIITVNVVQYLSHRSINFILE